jgi:hypothetical protein
VDPVENPHGSRKQKNSRIAEYVDKPAGYQQLFPFIFHFPGKNSFFWGGKPGD